MMSLAEFETEAKAGLQKAQKMIRDLLGVMPPEIQHDAIDAAKAGVDEIGVLATTEVNKVVPEVLQPGADAIIGMIEAKFQATVANLTAEKDTAIAAVKAAVPPAS